MATSSAVPLFIQGGEEGVTAFHPYVLEMEGPVAEVLGGQILCFVVMKRLRGALLAIPTTALSEEARSQAQLAGQDDLLGPSAVLEVQGASMDWNAPLAEPEVAEDMVSVLLMDFSDEVLARLKEVSDCEETLDLVTTFSSEDDALVPQPDSLIAAAMNWLGTAAEQERVAFYSAAEEAPLEVAESPQPPRRKGRAKVPGGTTTEEPGKSKKRLTLAQLAESLEKVTSAMPALLERVEDLSQRTSAMEVSSPAGRKSALKQPLGRYPTAGLPATSPLGSLVKDMPPPPTRSTSYRATFAAAPKIAEEETRELMDDLGASEQTDLAKAVLAQSQALTALVSQIAGSSTDPIHDLAGASSLVSSRGAAGRAKLQAELAQHRGTFYQAVMMAMARRMHPAMAAESSVQVLKDKGVTATRCLERFGGFGKVKDFGHIAWQLGLILDHLQEGNVNATKDAVALLLVAIEQTAIDQGKMELGLLMTLAEEPPQALFSNRALSLGSRPMAFAPLADQRWITTALQYIKELDTIVNRRSETSQLPQKPKDNPGQPKAVPKSKGKGGRKGKPKVEEEEQE